MTSFNDIFKSSFLNNVTAISIPDMLITIALCFALGMFIFFIYKKTYAGVMYSTSFGITLIALSMITGMTILAVTSNVVLSLGMVGALSIVRFRTAIKEPMDLIFLFWAISGGIVLAAGMIPLAIIGSICIGIMLIIMANHKTHVQPYVLVITCDNEQTESAAIAIIEKNCKKNVLKSKTVRKDGIEIDYEIRLAQNSTAFVNEINNIAGVKNATLVSFNGEYMG